MSATIEVPKTCKALPEPVAVLPHRVGDVITWGNVQPGTLVRLRDNREVLRWRECDAYGDDVAIMYPGRPCPGKVWKHGHKDRDITTEVADAALHKVRDITADISPCVVLGAGLSERMCAALAEVDDQPQRWAIANGYYGKVSSMPAGSAWTYPGGWGVTFYGGQVAWVNYNGDDLIRMSRTEVLELETRLGKCKPTYNDLFVFGLAHCEIEGLPDDVLESIITHSDPHTKLMSQASMRCYHGALGAMSRKWISEQVADFATFHVRPDVRSDMEAKVALCVLDILREPSPSTRRAYMPTAWPTLRALGIHICKPDADADLYGWWGQENAPTRAASAVDLFLAYLADAPGYAACARATLGDLDLARADVRLRAAEPSTLQTTISLPSFATSDDEDYQLTALAEQVSVQLYRRDPWHARVTVPSHRKIIDDARGVAVLTEIFWMDVESKAAPAIDCGLQPVVLNHDHPCGVLVLWPYDPSPRGRRLLAAAAVALVRQTRAAEGDKLHKKLRIQFA